jgi:hypothetical protein
MNARLDELRRSVTTRDEERRQLRENAVDCVREIRADLAEAEQIVAKLSDGEPVDARPRRAKKAKPPAGEKPSVKKPDMISALRKIIAENDPLTSDELWDLAEEHLKEDYQRSGAKMIFDKTITEAEFQSALRRPFAATVTIAT